MKTANVSKRLFAALLAVLMFVGMLPFGALSFTAQAAEVTGASLASVPAVRGDVTSASGAFTLTSQSRFYIVSDTDPTGTALGTYVQTASSEFAAEGKPVGTTLPIVYGAETNAAEGDIVIKVDASLGKSEMYNLTVTSSNIEITASDAAGVLHALHTVLQSLVNGSTNSLACVTASDWPDVSERSVYLDCGRIFFSVDSVKAMIRTLSWNKMNVLYLDFSNNNATRFFLNSMNVTVDGTTYDITKAKPSDGYWNEDNMNEILAEAYKYGVEIIPTFNSPGHIGGLRSVNTSFFASKSASDYDSGTGKVALNISNDASYSFGQQVVKLYVDYFCSKGCKNFNIAADEATDAIDGLDSTGSVFVNYVNDLNTYIKSKGMKTRMFNDAIKSVSDGVSSDITVLFWTPSTPSPEDLVLAGYDVVNFDWEYLYYAHGASDYWNCNVSKMYAWNPGAFKDSTTSSGYNADYNSGKQPAYSFSSNSSHGKIVGANFAIWTDFAHTANQNGEDVLKEKSCKYQNGSYGLRYKIYILAERGWSRTTDSVSYNTWKAGVINAPAGLDVSTGSFGTSSSLPTAQEITAAPITVETVTLTDDTTGITVSAPGIVKLVVTSKEARAISNAAAVRTYDITAYTDDGEEVAYQGEATVSFPIPSEWDLSNVVAYGITDGQVEFINGAFDGTAYTIKVSHFSEYGIVLLDITVPDYVNGTVSSSGTTEYTRQTSVSAGEYIIVPTTATTKALGYDGSAKNVSVSSSGNNTKLTLGTGVSESDVMWTFTGSNSSYAIKNGNYNLYPTSSYYGTSVVSTTDSGNLTVSARSNNPEQFLISRTVSDWFNDTTYYLRYNSGFTVTTSTGTNTTGRYFYLFAKTSTTAYTVNTASLEALLAYANTLNSESYSNWILSRVSALITAARNAVNSTSNPYSTDNAASLQQNAVNTAGKDLHDALVQLKPYEYNATVTIKPVCNGVPIGENRVYYVYGSSDPFSATVTLPQIEGYTHASYKYVVSGLANGDSKVIQVEYREVPDSIDIPISIVDYRSDGMLFEYDPWGTSVWGQLVANGQSTMASAQSDIPGTTIKQYTPKDNATGRSTTWATSGGAYIRQGLVEETLGSDGMPVYTDEAVKFVASKLAAGAYADRAKGAPNWNNIIADTFLESTSDRSVLTSTAPTEFSDAFAASKTYANISNAYDLAWYLLNTLFVPDKNMATVTDKSTSNGESYELPIYGMAVDAYDKLTLKRDTGGSYYLTAYNATEVIYDETNRSIYNSGTGSTTQGFFYPINDKGYDAYLGDTTDTTAKSSADTNYPAHTNGNYTLRGEAQFVYRKDDNLFFTFTGDDDVYLFVNGQLVFDLGGAHWSLEDTVYINDVADKLGLVDGEVATFTFFYMERFSDCSNFSMRTNLTLAEVDLGVEKNAYTEAGTQIPDGSVVEVGKTAYYEIAVENRSNVEISGISITDTDSVGNKLVIGKTSSTDFDLDYTSNAAKRADVALNGEGKAMDFVMYKKDADGNEVQGSEVTVYSLKDLSDALAKVTLEAGYKLCVRFTNATLYVGDLDSYSYTNNVTARIGTGNTASASHTIYTHSYGTETNVSYVVDFGLPLKLTSSDLPLKDTVLSIALSSKNDPKYGNVELTGVALSNGCYNPESITLTYTPTKMLSGVDAIMMSLTYQVSGNKTVTFDKVVSIIPASIVYYEDDSFITFGGDGKAWETVGTNSDVVQAVQKLGDTSTVYGYDDAYANSSTYSNGGVHKVTLTTGKYATATFSFKGTGFDLVSLTGSTTGTLVVSITNASGYSRNILVDTYYGYKKVDGKWVVDPEAKDALYQIPVVKVDNLGYGKYTVKITASYNAFFDHKNTGSYDLYIDAVRIYNPLGDTGNTFYAQDGEGWPTFEELRNLVLEANAIKSDETKAGAVFIDGDGANENVADYKVYGPKNELYLAKGQAIAFNVNDTDAINVNKIELALKSANGKAVKVTMLDAATGQIVTHTITSSTDLYYAIPTSGLVIVTNTGEDDAVLSITNIKTTYTSDPKDSVVQALFTVNKEIADEAVAKLTAILNAPEVFTPEYMAVSVNRSSVREGGYVTVTVKTSADVAAVTVNGIAMRRMLTVRGERSVWTADVKASKVGELKLDVVAVNADGIASEAITETVTVTEKIEISGILEDIFKKLSDRWFR